MGKVIIREWKDILEIKNGRDYKDVLDENGPYPIYGSGGIMGYAKDYICPENTVIIGRKGNINNPIFVDRKFWNVDTAFGLVPRGDYLHPKYLFYFCINYNFEKLNTTVTIPSLTKNNLLKLRMALPQLHIQKNIASTLDKTQEIIDGHKKQLAELDNLIKSVFYEMFGDPVGNRREWEKVLIEEAYEIIDGDRGVNYPKQDDFSNKGYCVFLNTGNVTTDGFNFDKVQYISMEKDRQLRKGKLFRGDIVFTTRGTVGNIAFYNNTIPYNIVRINSGMVLLRNKSYLSHPVFFCHLFRNPSMVRYYKTFLSGTAQPQLPITNLRKIEVILPPIDLQNKFAEIVTKIEEQKKIVMQAITESGNLFSSLMNGYFD